MGSLGQHRDYLESNNFSNLDELDEQILNDNTLSQNSSAFTLSDAQVNATIRDAENILKKDKLTQSDEAELNKFARDIEQALSYRDMSARSRRKLLALLDEIKR